MAFKMISSVAVFMFFIVVLAALFNDAVRKCSFYRKSPVKRHKRLYNMYTMAYSSIVSIMLIASLCFPPFLARTFNPNDVRIPTVSEIVQSRTDAMFNQFADNIEGKIQTELDNMGLRYINDSLPW